jgi:hypothetical protein
MLLLGEDKDFGVKDVRSGSSQIHLPVSLDDLA